MRRLYGVIFCAVLPLTGCQGPAAGGHAGALHGGQEPHPPGATHAAPEPEPAERTRALDLSAMTDLDGIVPRLAEHRVVYVGEQHDRYDHHLNQLAVVRALHERGIALAVGMEFFQQPFQAYLDDYVAGRIDTRALLRESEYFERWRFDFRLYQPILEYAREQGIPLIALNVPGEVVRKISREGLDALSEEERRWLTAQRDRDNPRYRERIESVFRRHPNDGQVDFENFLDAQLTWDEGMAERAANYLEEHPERTLVVLAGVGHVMFGDGIPARVARRAPVPYAVVVNGSEAGIEPDIADFVLLPKERRLPAPGRLGVILDVRPEGLRVDAFADASAAAEAGVEHGDWLTELDGQAVRAMTDVRVTMWDKRPGDRVAVRVRREGWFGREQLHDFEVVLR